MDVYVKGARFDVHSIAFYTQSVCARDGREVGHSVGPIRRVGYYQGF